MRSQSAVLVMSDIHYGKKTPSFSPDICIQRLENIGKRLIGVKNHLGSGSNPFDELVIAILGDVNDGTDIYATQSHHQAVTNVEQQAREIASVLHEWLVGQSKHWPKIRIVVVPGNHGRTGRGMNEASNWDMVTYRYLQLMSKDLVEIDIGEDSSEDVFLRKMTVRRHHYILYHGHDIHAYGGAPLSGILTRTTRWQTSKVLSPFDVVLTGHFHSFGMWQVNQIQILATGTMVTDDHWALRTLGWESSNKWWIFGVSDDRPITWQLGLDLV